MTTPVPGEAARLRQSIYDKDAATRTDLTGLIALGPKFGDDPEFLSLIADVARDVMTVDVDPPGYVGDEDADWLTARLGDGAGLSCRAEFEVLKAIMANAVSVAPILVDFAVREIERAILTGQRHVLGGAVEEPAVVTGEDVEALRAVCFAPTANAACHVDRACAEALFDIAHATASADNDPAFADFFAKAVGNYLLGAVFVEAPSRMEALAQERLDTRAVFRQFLGHLVLGLSEFSASVRSVEQLADDRYHQENAETEARLQAASRIDAGEAKWIVAHLARGGALSPAERRLLAFLRDEAASSPPEIEALYENAA